MSVTKTCPNCFAHLFDNYQKSENMNQVLGVA